MSWRCQFCTEQKFFFLKSNKLIFDIAPLIRQCHCRSVHCNTVLWRKLPFPLRRLVSVSKSKLWATCLATSGRHPHFALLISFSICLKLIYKHEVTHKVKILLLHSQAQNVPSLSFLHLWNNHTVFTVSLQQSLTSVPEVWHVYQNGYKLYFEHATWPYFTGLVYHNNEVKTCIDDAMCTWIKGLKKQLGGQVGAGFSRLFKSRNISKIFPPSLPEFGNRGLSATNAAVPPICLA